jgi:hypothetical protein
MGANGSLSGGLFDDVDIVPAHSNPPARLGVT